MGGPSHGGGDEEVPEGSCGGQEAGQAPLRRCTPQHEGHEGGHESQEVRWLQSRFTTPCTSCSEGVRMGWMGGGQAICAPFVGISVHKHRGSEMLWAFKRPL